MLAEDDDDAASVDTAQWDSGARALCGPTVTDWWRTACSRGARDQSIDVG